MSCHESLLFLKQLTFLWPNDLLSNSYRNLDSPIRTPLLKGPFTRHSLQGQAIRGEKGVCQFNFSLKNNTWHKEKPSAQKNLLTFTTPIIYSSSPHHSSANHTLPYSPEKSFLALETYEARVTSAERRLFLNQFLGPTLFLLFQI